MTETVIKVDNVSKSFKLPHEKQGSIKGLFLNIFRLNQTFEKQRALTDISFEVKEGEFFGIVGRNGSGKSTLLKLLAGIYTADTGSIQVKGSLTPFIELGVGFNPELTGRQNVFLNGALLGFSRKEMTEMYDEIVDFAEIERFMDQKLKNYSSGMQVRLAFSIAIRAKSDILLIDEVLAVGDASFQQKCFDSFAELKRNGTTIVLVTHDMNSVLRFCDRAMLIHKTKLIEIGKPSDVAEAYLELNYDAHEGKSNETKNQDPDIPSITSVTMKNTKNQSGHTFSPHDEVVIDIDFANPLAKICHFGVQIFNDAGVYCFGTNTKICDMKPTNKTKGRISSDVLLGLAAGNYYLTISIMNETATSVYSYRPKIAEFRIKKDSQLEGIALLTHTWKY